MDTVNEPTTQTSTAIIRSRNGKRKLNSAEHQNYSLPQHDEEEIDDGNNVGHVATLKLPQKTQRPSALPLRGVENNAVDELFNPPVCKEYLENNSTLIESNKDKMPPPAMPTEKAATTKSALPNHTTVVINKPQHTRKPLSSVGLSGIKSKGGTASKRGVEMNGTAAKRTGLPKRNDVEVNDRGISSNQSGKTNNLRQQGQQSRR